MRSWGLYGGSLLGAAPGLCGGAGFLLSLNLILLSCLSSSCQVWVPKGFPVLTLQNSDRILSLLVGGEPWEQMLSSLCPLTSSMGVRLALEGDTCELGEVTLQEARPFLGS